MDQSVKVSKVYSCVRCFSRKTKCDKKYPCAACLHAKVDCVFRAPTAPRRRPYRHADDAVFARLQHYERLLDKNGIEFEPLSLVNHNQSEKKTLTARDRPNSRTTVSKSTNADPPSLNDPSSSHMSSSEAVQGRLIINNGRARFIANKLWDTISEESLTSKEIMPDSDSESEIETAYSINQNIDVLLEPQLAHFATIPHPDRAKMSKLWQIYLSNVNPLLKITHQPTLEEKIASITDPEHISRGLDALLFAIYGAAVFSMRDGECQATFAEDRAILMSRYILATRISLAKARFMGSSDIMVLQAFVLHLITVRQDLDSRTLWTLSGVATRIAQGMGVHRDGSVLGLPPLETEMRRRLWLQIAVLDRNACELGGFGLLNDTNWWPTKPPCNIDDADIWPDMEKPPVEKSGATEMIVVLLRMEVLSFWKKKLVQWNATEQEFTRAVRSWTQTATVLEKDAFMQEFEVVLNEKYLRHCDLSNPFHFFASIVARMTVKSKSMQVRLHFSSNQPADRDMAQSERKFLWTTSMELLEADNLAHSHRSLQKFNWFIDMNFQWHALLYALRELIIRPTGHGKDDAWTQLEQVFKNHPRFISDHKRPLHSAIASMCLKAWRARHTAQVGDPQGSSWLDMPLFIEQMQELRSAVNTKSHVQEATPIAAYSRTRTENKSSTMMQSPDDNASVPKTGEDVGDFDFPMIEDMEVDWQTWESMYTDFEVPPIPQMLDATRL